MTSWLKKGIEAVVFDLEGTLVRNIPYESVLRDVSEIIGVPFKDLLRRYQKNWRGLKEALMFHLSLAATPAQTSEIELVYAGFKRGKEMPEVLPGARELLERLSSRGFYLVCWTQGERELQLRALESSGLDFYFSAAVVVGSKNAEAVRSELLPFLKGRAFALVGDSLEADILAARGLASQLVWVSGSEANRYRPVVGLEVPEEAEVVESIRELL